MASIHNTAQVGPSIAAPTPQHLQAHKRPRLAEEPEDVGNVSNMEDVQADVSMTFKITFAFSLISYHAVVICLSLSLYLLNMTLIQGSSYLSIGSQWVMASITTVHISFLHFYRTLCLGAFSLFNFFHSYLMSSPGVGSCVYT